MKNKYLLFLSYFLLAMLTVSLYAVGYLRRDLARQYFSYSGYYFMLLLVLAWAGSLLLSVKHSNLDITSSIRSHRKGILFCVVLAIIVFVSVKPYFRVLSDETNLVGVSKSMLYERRTDNVTMGKWYFDMFTPLNREMEKRPLLFPFFEQIMHLLFGYRAENVFFLNFLVLLALFLALYAFIQQYLGELWAISAVLLAASQPIVTQCATSGGFELCSALFLVLSCISLLRYLEGPSPDRLALLWTSLLLFANIRYEGALAFIVTIGALFLYRAFPLDYLRKKTALLYYATPLLFLPLFWQRLLKGDSYQNPSGVAPFSPAHFLENNSTMVKSFLDFRFYLPYATAINIVGVIGLLSLTYAAARGRMADEQQKKRALIIVALNVCLYWILYSSYYFGRIEHPSSSRFFVFFYIVLSVLALVPFTRVAAIRNNPFLMLIISATMFALYHPVSVEDRFSRTQTLPREYRFTMAFFHKQEKSNPRFLVVAERPGQYTVQNYGAVEFSYAAANYSTIIQELRNRLYSDVFVIQTITYSSGQPTRQSQLDARYSLETVAEAQNDADSLVRISRVKTDGVQEALPRLGETKPES